MTSNQQPSPRLRFALAAALALVAGCASLRGARAEPGQPAPALAGTLLDGSAFELAALRGQVVLVNFWATWCGPCREEMPWIDAFYQEHRAQGFTVIGVSEDARRDRAEVLRAMSGMHYPALLRGDASANGFGSPSTLPMSYVIDRSGVIRAVISPSSASPTAAMGTAGATGAIQTAVHELLKTGP